MTGYHGITQVALAIVPGLDGTITFQQQRRGPYAGAWLLPGGRVEPGETAERAARREAFEEAGVTVDELALTAVYEVRGEWSAGGYHFVINVFLTEPCRVPPGFVGDVAPPVQAHWRELSPHPTARRALNDAGAAGYLEAAIAQELGRDGITVRRLTTAG